jgi:riboflavin-specific deaminase-like protein
MHVTALTAAAMDVAADSAWKLVLAAAALAPVLERAGRSETYAIDDFARLERVGPDHGEPSLIWDPQRGWQARLGPGDRRSALLDLFLPLCAATEQRPITIGHLGQSLDGFIATHSGDSRFVTGDDNILHMHRLRALCDAVVVGAGTVAVDNPQLTTRRVTGSSPLRIVIDPERRVPPSAGVFVDQAAPTYYLCGRSQVAGGETHVGSAVLVPIDAAEMGGAAVTEALAFLRQHGCALVFVEGGGVTVSAFLEARLLDRLQITIAPVIIGDGRPAIRLTPAESLSECLRPAYRVFRMGGDVLFDCDLRSGAVEAPAAAVARVI